MAAATETTGFAENVDLVGVGIESITYLGEQEVCDIETEKYHTFLANGIAVHNCQNFDPDLEMEVSQIQSASETPITIYAGTSLTTDTFLERKYQLSSQCSWMTKCRACGEYNIPLMERGVLRMIGPKGPVCFNCSRPINFREGYFVPAHRGLHETGRRGYHIPQIIVPAVYNNPQRWAKIHEMAQREGGNRKFAQEILGIAVEEGEREITRQNLMDICVLPSIRVLQERAIHRQYDYVVSGCDWGGSDHIPTEHLKISTTVHVMMGVTHDGLMEILHLRRYLGMGYDDTIRDILYHHQLFRGNAIASDHGMGMAYNSKIREVVMPEKHLIFQYTGPTTAFIDEPGGAHAYNYWSLNKTESISQLYEAVRHKRIRCFCWEQAEEYLKDFLNMFRAPGEQAGGASTIIYRSSASQPNDTLQAVNYAYVLARILRDEPIFSDRSLQLRLQQSLQGPVVDLEGLQGYSG